MTVMLICLAAILAGVSLFVWDYCGSDYNCWKWATGLTLCILGGIVLIFNLFFWVPSERESEIQYQQLVQEKQTIEIMLDGYDSIDRFLLNQKVIDYNNRVIAAKENSQRFVMKDYYSDDVDWMSLEVIEWR